MYSERRENGQKPPPNKTFQTKDPLTKPPDKKPREQLRENLYRGFLSGFLALGLLSTKNRGGPRCVTYFGRRVQGCVTKCDRGKGGSKLAKISVTYFMDVPELAL